MVFGIILGPFFIIFTSITTKIYTMAKSRILWIIVAAWLSAPLFVRAQCNYQSYMDSCRTHITHDNFNFLKEYEIDNKHGESQKIEYSIALVDGFEYEYYFTGLKEGHQEVTATLYDSNRQELGTNKHHKNFVHVIRHTSRKTGIYYITFTFKDDEAYCGAAVLGFTKNSGDQ